MLILFIGISVPRAQKYRQRRDISNLEFWVALRKEWGVGENHSRDKASSRILFNLLKLHYIRYFEKKLI